MSLRASWSVWKAFSFKKGKGKRSWGQVGWSHGSGPFHELGGLGYLWFNIRDLSLVGNYIFMNSIRFFPWGQSRANQIIYIFASYCEKKKKDPQHHNVFFYRNSKDWSWFCETAHRRAVLILHGSPSCFQRLNEEKACRKRWFVENKNNSKKINTASETLAWQLLLDCSPPKILFSALNSPRGTSSPEYSAVAEKPLCSSYLQFVK